MLEVGQVGREALEVMASRSRGAAGNMIVRLGRPLFAVCRVAVVRLTIPAEHIVA